MIVVRVPPAELTASPARVVSDTLPPSELAATYGDPAALVVDVVTPETDFGGLPLETNPVGDVFLLMRPDGTVTVSPFPDPGQAADEGFASYLDAIVKKVDDDISKAIAELNVDIAATTALLHTAIDTATLHAQEALDEVAANGVIISSIQDGLASIQTLALVHSTTLETIAGELTTFRADLAFASAQVTAETVARTSAIEAIAVVQTRLSASISDAHATMNTEQIVRATADDALTASITSLTSTVGSVSAALSVEITTRASADTALAGSITTLTTNLGTTNANLSSEITTRSSADSALSALITAETASRVSDIGTVTASVTTEVAARVAGDTALAASISTLSTTVSGHTATITTILASLNGVEAQWAVQATLNGVSGHLEFDGLQRADGTGAVFVFDILADVNIHGSLVVNGTIINGKLANESATVIRSATSPSTISIPGGFPFSTTTTIFTWTFNSPVAGNTQVDYSAVFNVGGGTSLGVGSSVTQINVYLDGTLQEIDQMTTGLNTRTFSFASLASGNHTIRVDCSILGDGSTVSNQILRSFIGSK